MPAQSLEENTMFFSNYIQQYANTLKGGLYGLILGDAVGRSFEFKSRDEIPSFDDIDIIPPKNYKATYPNVPVGTWTDDSSQALALLDSLIQTKDDLNLIDFSTKLIQWLHEGKYTPDGVVFDCGIQTRNALNKIANGIEVENAAQRDIYANGNGALMRVLPLVLWHYGEDSDLVRLAIKQGTPTHGHIRSGVVCAFYCFIARKIIDHALRIELKDEIQELKQYLNDEEKAELDLIFNSPQRTNPGGSGYVIDTLWGAVRSIKLKTNFADVVRAAISLGNDTDTTAAVAGGLAGLKYGYNQLPKEWLSHLKGIEIIEQLFSPLEKRIINKIKYEIDLLIRFKDFAAACRLGKLSNDEMESNFEELKKIIHRPFWENGWYIYLNPDANFYSIEEIDAVVEFERITGYITFVNRLDTHSFIRRYIKFHNSSWNPVIMSGMFEVMLNKLLNEINNTLKYKE
jgi:ADP-ribosyl-[dinitrogen reductase] hydrolase